MRLPKLVQIKNNGSASLSIVGDGSITELFTSCTWLSINDDGSSLSDSKMKRQKFENQVN